MTAHEVGLSADEAVRLYSVAELAKLWGVSEWFVREEIRADRLPTVQIGRGDRNKLRVPAVAAARWVQRHMPPPPAE